MLYTITAGKNMADFETTGVFSKLAEVTDKRVVVLYGGSSSSKTITALQYLTAWCLKGAGLVVTVVGESIPVIKRSVLRDWQRVVMQDMFERDRFNKIENTYTFANGSVLQFIPADDENRFVAMRHDLVLIDEAYNVSKGIFDQLDIRTRVQLLLTFNPVSPFWATSLQDERDDVAVIHATYKDNPFLEQSIVDALELRAKHDLNFYRVFVLGQYGTLEGLVFREGEHWSKTDEMPQEFKRRVFVVDYGFSYDPTAILDLRLSDGQFWVHEIEYTTGLFNNEIAEILKGAGAVGHEVVCDSAEPKSNAELRRLGINVVEAKKGQDSVVYGIRKMQEFRLNVTRDSKNTVKELRNYKYIKDKDGEYRGKLSDGYNHSIDALRYGITHIMDRPRYRSYSVS